MIRPYYQDTAVTIYHGDCREIVPKLGRFDLLLTDPPYLNLAGGVTHMGGSGVAKTVQPSQTVGNEWGANADWVPLVTPLISEAAFVFCCFKDVCNVGGYFPEKLCLLTWLKRNSAGPVQNVPHFTTEFCWGFRFGNNLNFRAIKSTCLDIPAITAGCVSNGERVLVSPNGKAAHPTQKPLALISSILAIGGETILDPFAGTCTTARAAKDLGRKCVCIEREERYCEIGARRMSQEVFDLN